MPEILILVNEEDNIIGTEEKLKAHIDGLLHRAFSVMIFNNKGQLMMLLAAELRGIYPKSFNCFC